MSLPSIFSLPIAPYHQPRSARESQYGSKKRKRKPSENLDESKEEDIHIADKQVGQPPGQQGSQFSEYTAVLTPNERSQYRVAGQPFDLDPPKKPFPHAPQSQNVSSVNAERNLQKQLASMDPPVYSLGHPSRKTRLHQQHLGVITAILHRALSEKDFVRAGRAFGLILRDEIRGRAMDIRDEGRWGIGAEILLRQGAQLEQEGPKITADSDQMDSEERRPSFVTWFTREGFEMAKKYYERLLVQYPFHKLNPGAVSALDFYPAMFGLWIYVVQEESKHPSTLSYTSDLDGSSQVSSPSQEMQQPQSRTKYKQRELEQAREIASQMDTCMNNIPYSDDLELLSLRGMVALWIASLIDETSEQQRDEIEDARFGQSRESIIETARKESTALREKAAEMFGRIRGHQDGFE